MAYLFLESTNMEMKITTILLKEKLLKKILYSPRNAKPHALLMSNHPEAHA